MRCQKRNEEFIYQTLYAEAGVCPYISLSVVIKLSFQIFRHNDLEIVYSAIYVGI